MKNWMTALSMAWGNFTVLPCPYKRWDSKLNNRMLLMLPVVGLVLGLLWAVVLYGSFFIGFPEEVTAFFGVLYLYGCCGFMHLDGFMDCNDAILSRRPLEDRQRILKDSRVGAFAVVTVCFLLIGSYVAMLYLVKHGFFAARPRYMTALWVGLPVVSRVVSGAEVLFQEPIGHSQYKESFRNKDKAMCLAGLLVLGILIVGALWFYSHSQRLMITFACEALWAYGVSRYAQHQLGGMSGDIAGYTICLGEIMGLIVATV